MALHYTTIFLISLGLAQATTPPPSNLIVDVESYGAIADGTSDNTQAIQSAVAALRTGQTLYFPCSTGHYYSVSSPINFGHLNSMQIMGSGPGCFLYYQGAVAQPYAFSFVGAQFINITNMAFSSAMSGANPEVVLLLGRTAPSVASGHFRINGVSVQGYATQALVYSIASEENAWLQPTLNLNGGGARYVFYTSGSDDLGVANLPSSSNLSLWMQNFQVCDYSPNIDSTHVLIYDNGNASSSGSHTYHDGYLASKNGTAFAFYSNGAGAIAWLSLSVEGNRFESGYQMFYFGGSGSFGDIILANNKTASVTNYMIDLPTTCYNCTFQANVVEQGNTAVSQFGVLQDSFLSENYPFTVGKVINSTVINRALGTLQISSAASTAACSSVAEGTMRYLPGSGSRNGSFQICQLQAGTYSWVTH